MPREGSAPPALPPFTSCWEGITLQLALQVTWHTLSQSQEKGNLAQEPKLRGAEGRDAAAEEHWRRIFPQQMV